MRQQLPVAVKEHSTCVSKVPLFQGLNLEDQLRVARFANPRRVRKGEYVFLSGENTTSLFVIHRGRVKVTRIRPSGAESVIRILGPGDFLGEQAFITGEELKNTAIAVEDCEMCVFLHEDLAALMRTYPSIGMRLLQTMSRRLSAAEWRLSVVGTSVSQRVADYLLSLPVTKEGRADPSGNPVVRLPVTKKDVATLLFTTSESLSRQLRAFQDAGLITMQGRLVKLNDLDALMNLAGD